MNGFVLFTIRYKIGPSSGFHIDSFQYFDIPPDSLTEEAVMAKLTGEPSEQLKKLEYFLLYVPIRSRFNNDIDPRIFKVNLDEEISSSDLETYLISLGDELKSFLKKAAI